MAEREAVATARSSLAWACSATRSIGSRVSMMTPSETGVIALGLGGGRMWERDRGDETERSDR